MGTNSEAEHQDENSKVEETVDAVTGLSSAAFGFTSMVASCLSCRSGDDTADGGHMRVPSMGQAIWFISSANCVASPANDRSGTVHIVPMT